MLQDFPTTIDQPLDWTWADWQPHFQRLVEVELTEDNIHEWLSAWTSVSYTFREVASRLSVAKDVDTNDEAAAEKYKRFQAEIVPEVQRVTFALNKKLVDSGLAPDSIAVPVRDIQAQIELFHEDNLPLHTRESELGMEYGKISGAQTVEWDGEEITLVQLRKVFTDADREKRERAWLLMQERMKQDREAHNDLWRQYMALRKQIYQNAGLDDYRQYAWKDRNRHDYTPEDALQFFDAVEKVVVPAAVRIYEERRQKLGLETLRPWDLDVELPGYEPLMPYETIEEFESKTEAIFNRVDPELGGYFATMRQENLLDLDNRKGKAPGGYCTAFPLAGRPFIFMNAVGLEGDVRTLLHEAGHAFHVFSGVDLPYSVMRRSPMEFNEVASMAMELLASPYLTQDQGGYFDEDEARRFMASHLKKIIRFWPYMAQVASFQHWIYTHHDLATDPEECDKKWLELWGRFMRGVDWSGYEDYIRNIWRRQLHIFYVPFYYIEYGLAQLGAVQVWANALEDQAAALAAYREALKLGGTVTLPELYETAGAKLAFDAETLQAAVDLIERTLADLEPEAV